MFSHHCCNISRTKHTQASNRTKHKSLDIERAEILEHTKSLSATSPKPHPTSYHPIPLVHPTCQILVAQCPAQGDISSP
jgi:hypothetical protein